MIFVGLLRNLTFNRSPPQISRGSSGNGHAIFARAGLIGLNAFCNQNVEAVPVIYFAPAENRFFPLAVFNNGIHVHGRLKSILGRFFDLYAVQDIVERITAYEIGALKNLFSVFEREFLDRNAAEGKPTQIHRGRGLHFALHQDALGIIGFDLGIVEKAVCALIEVLGTQSAQDILL